MMDRHRFDRDWERSRKRWRLFGGAFAVVWGLAFALIVGSIVAGIYFQYQCYASQDPSSFACWFASDRVEIGVRQR